jgi:demethylmenaquinone methyltransferase/2-methoxy-6-polyprenyl-1,4-benzoquinol methylase
MFEAIAPSYDRLNHWLSLGTDLRWRSRAAREAIERGAPALVLDLASGTGDQVVALLRRSGRARVIRLDLSPKLLRRAGGKWEAGDLRSAPPVVAEMERLPFRDRSLDAITMAFALRHVESLDRLMRECARVIREDGRLSFVDMALPDRGAWARLYLLYFRGLLPRLAGLLGGDRGAYQAMIRSVESFPGWERLEDASRRAGFREIRMVRMTGGAARIFVATQ